MAKCKILGKIGMLRFADRLQNCGKNCCRISAQVITLFQHSSCSSSFFISPYCHSPNYVGQRVAPVCRIKSLRAVNNACCRQIAKITVMAANSEAGPATIPTAKFIKNVDDFLAGRFPC